MSARKRPIPPPEASAPARRETSTVIALAAAIALAVSAAHWPALSAQALALDDDLFVVSNRLVQHPGWESTRRFFSEVTNPSTVSAYYLPLSMTSLMLDWAAGGRPGHLRAFHVTSLALHVLATLLLFLLLLRLFGSAVPAALAALVYGVHPLMVEAVASAGERKTVLATAFAFASVLAHAYFATTRARRWQVVSLACFALALLSKPSALTLPLGLIVLEAWPLRRLSMATVLEKWPFLALSAVSGVISILAVRHTWEFGSLPPLDVPRMLAQVVWLQGFYLGKVFWPAGLSTVYAAPVVYTLTDPAVALPIAGAVLAGVACMVLRHRVPGLLAGGLVALVLLAPTFALLRYSPVIAYDRYLHLPALGLGLALAATLVRVWQWEGVRARLARQVTVLAMLGVALAAGVVTRATWAHWRDTLGLWQHVVRVSPGMPGAWNGLGATYSGLGDSAKAAECFRRAIAADSSYADAQQNLGRELMLLGRMDEALPHLQLALALEPGSAPAAFQLGVAYQRLGRASEAAASFQRSLAIRPDDTAARTRLGAAQAALGRLDEAIATLRWSLSLEPGEPYASLSLATVIERRTGASAEVVQLLQQAIAAKPDWADPFNELAWVLATAADSSLRDPGEALRLSQLALGLTRSPDPSLLDTRAASLAAAGRFAEAAGVAERASVLAHEQSLDSLRADIDRRARLYRRGRPFVQQPASNR